MNSNTYTNDKDSKDTKDKKSKNLMEKKIVNFEGLRSRLPSMQARMKVETKLNESISVGSPDDKFSQILIEVVDGEAI